MFIARNFQLIADSIGLIAFDVEQHLIGSRDLSIEQLQRYSNFLDQIPPLIRIADRVDTIDRFFELDGYQIMAAQNEIQSGIIFRDDLSFPIRIMDRCGYFTNWNAAMIVHNELIDRMVVAAREPIDHLRIKKMADVEDHVERLVKTRSRHVSVFAALVSGPSARGRWMGVYLADNALLNSLPLARAEIRSAMERDLTRVGVALELFRIVHRELPSALDELIPEFLDEVPIDRFNGQDLEYEITRKGFVIRSSDERSAFIAAFQSN